VALDLGSTALKAGLLDARERIVGVASVPAPPLRGTGLVREGDAEAYASAALGLLRSVLDEPRRGIPLGIATQRSTFVLWDARTGHTRTPMVSWQDRRAAGWCEAHRDLDREVQARTGLLLSAHYAGPKLAAMLEADAELCRDAQAGHLRFGTLETFLLWRWTAGRVHETDATVAARTTMFDLEREDWSPDLLAAYGVPRAILPGVAPSAGRSIGLDPGPTLGATLADQAASAVAVLDESGANVLITLGTGAFVLRHARDLSERRPGYLFAPVLVAGERRRYVVEGTINGAGPAVDRFGPGPTELPERDPAPGAFALPDVSGLGSPYWRPDLGLVLSPAAQRLGGPGARRVVLEGVLFRIAEVLDGLSGGSRLRSVVLSGGLARDPAVGLGLAALLGRTVERLLDEHAGLSGIGRLAAGLAPLGPRSSEVLVPGPRGAYLPAKLREWKDWMRSVVGAPPGGCAPAEQ
jgi:glycerol kinase